MAQEDFIIIKAIVESKDKEFTIHQLSKAIKKSYAYTNKYAHELLKKEILKKKEVGPSILCSLNFASEETIASLVYMSMLKKASLKKNEKTTLAIEKFSQAVILYSYNNLLYLLSDEKLKNPSLIVLSKEIFMTLAKSYDLSNLTILSGYEEFWKLMAKVMP